MAITYPASAGVINVRTMYGAAGNGVTDDTAAIQQALYDHAGRHRVIYFPAGTYIISDTLRFQRADGTWVPYTVLQGESLSTIIRLVNNAPGYQNSTIRKAMIYTASGLFSESPFGGGKDWPALGEGNEAFGNSVFNMTIDAGDNPGAVGIDWLCNNWGSIRDVDIIGQGVAGISMLRKWPGPCLITEVRINGFDYGLDVAHNQYGVTIDGLELNNQRFAGIRNNNNALSIDRLFGNTATVQEAGNLPLTTFAGEHTEPFYSLFGPPSSFGPLGLEAPVVPAVSDVSPGAFAGWAVVTDFGTTNLYVEPHDDRAAIQAAMDSGAKVIWFPQGHYMISDTVNIPDTVQLVHFSQVGVTDGGFSGTVEKPKFRLVGNNPNAITVFENLEGWAPFGPTEVGNFSTIEHGGDGTLVLRHGQFREFRNLPGAGPTYFQDVTCRNVRVNEHEMWMRQWNPEGPAGAPKAIVTNSQIWCLGIKTERNNTVMEIRDSIVEIAGGLIFPGSSPGINTPAFDVIDSDFSASFVVLAYQDGNDYPVIIRETRMSQTQQLLREDVLANGAGRKVPLFIGDKSRLEIPVEEHLFSGTIINGETAVDGTLIEALTHDVVGASTVVAGGSWSLLVPGHVGDVVTFQVNGEPTEEAVSWVFGGQTTLALNVLIVVLAPHLVVGSLVDSQIIADGTQIAAMVNTAIVNTAVAGDGIWTMFIDGMPGDIITFSVNGSPADQSLVWVEGGSTTLSLTTGIVSEDPHKILGHTLEGEPAVDDTVIDALINGQAVATATVIGGLWSLLVEGSNGDIIAFEVDGVTALETVVWVAGDQTVIALSTFIPEDEPVGAGISGGQVLAVATVGAGLIALLKR